MLELKGALALNGALDCSLDAGLVFRMDVLMEPSTAWIFGIGNKLLAIEVAHLGPIRTHAIDDVGSCLGEGAEPIFTVAHGLLCFMANTRQIDVRVYTPQEFTRPEGLYQV